MSALVSLVIALAFFLGLAFALDVDLSGLTAVTR